MATRIITGDNTQNQLQSITPAILSPIKQANRISATIKIVIVFFQSGSNKVKMKLRIHDIRMIVIVNRTYIKVILLVFQAS